MLGDCRWTKTTHRDQRFFSLCKCIKILSLSFPHLRRYFLKNNSVQGHCETDSDCNDGWSKCGDDLCMDRVYFPLDSFPNNTELASDQILPANGGNVLTGFFPTDNCCYRVCNSRYNLCGLNEVGCSITEDCARGFVCNTSRPQPKCEKLCSPESPCQQGQV